MDNAERLKIALVVAKRERTKPRRTPPLARQIPPSPKERQREIARTAEASYDQLEGEWQEWFEVAKRYEHKVLAQDRLDIRHDIIIELYEARQRDGKPIPTLRAYRIASLTVALYWRQLIKPLVKVCVLDGLPKKPDHYKCRFKHKPAKCQQCPFLAVRPIQSLDSEVEDEEGNLIALKETIADDNALDIEAWVDQKIWLQGCRMRLIEIARKKSQGIPLSWKDHKYWERTIAKERAKYQKTFF